MSQQRPLVAGLRELAIIVVGVLIALAVDRWNEGLESARREAEYIGRIEADLLVDSTGISLGLEGLEGARNDLLHALVSLDDGVPTPDVFSMFIRGLNPGGITYAQDATYREMVSTGSLSLVRDPDLRSSVAGYYQFTERYAKSLEIARARGRDPLAEFVWDTDVGLPEGFRPDPAGAAEALRGNPAARRAVSRAIQWLERRNDILLEWQGSLGAALRALREGR